MAIGIYFAVSGLNADKYNECIKRLKQAGAGHPASRSYHAAFGPSDKLMVFDVWSSQAAGSKKRATAKKTALRRRVKKH